MAKITCYVQSGLWVRSKVDPSDDADANLLVELYRPNAPVEVEDWAIDLLKREAKKRGIEVEIEYV